MKWLLLMAVAGVLMLPPVADARDWRGFGPLVQAQGQPMRKGPPEQYQRERGDRDKQRAPGPERGQPGRLTQEERRDLHRDLDRANREIYRRH